jgi:hypothetical protein
LDEEPVAAERSGADNVSISIRRRGGRQLLAPDGKDVTAVPVHRHIENAMVKAIARAFRWRVMLESGDYATVREIANAEKINETYVGRVLRLTLLAPDIVEAVLGGRQPAEMTWGGDARRIPVGWGEQRAHIFEKGTGREKTKRLLSNARP